MKSGLLLHCCVVALLPCGGRNEQAGTGRAVRCVSGRITSRFRLQVAARRLAWAWLALLGCWGCFWPQTLAGSRSGAGCTSCKSCKSSSGRDGSLGNFVMRPRTRRRRSMRSLLRVAAAGGRGGRGAGCPRMTGPKATAGVYIAATRGVCCRDFCGGSGRVLVAAVAGADRVSQVVAKVGDYMGYVRGSSTR